MALWLVRAGKNGEQEQFALENDCVAISSIELDRDLSKAKERDDIVALLKDANPDSTNSQRGVWASQIWAFVAKMNEGDLVALPLKQTRTIAVGHITGPYVFRPENPPDTRHTRTVTWVKKDMPRSWLDEDLLRSFGALQTVCSIERNNAEARIEKLLRDGPAPNPFLKSDGTYDEEILKQEFALFRKEEGNRLMAELRDRRSQQVNALLTSGEPLNPAAFHLEIWRLTAPIVHGDVPVSKLWYDRPEEIARTRQALESNRLELKGSMIWEHATSVIGPNLSDEKREALVHEVCEILADKAREPRTKYQDLKALYGLGPALASGLVALFHPDQFAIFNEPCRQAMGKLGFMGLTVEQYQKIATEIRDLVGASNFLELDWFFYRLANQDPDQLATPVDPLLQGSVEDDDTCESYSIDQALEGLFMEHETFEDILAQLRFAKNIILQGPPGVGKTFVARRIAYALMQQRDDDRIGMVQFHQSYSYEDFVQGIRPDENGGFRRRNGLFFRFCELARRDPSRPYVFIIDEINRGNLSKIFGELMMLIEADKRAEEWAIPLQYGKDDDSKFFVPANVHVIGMMNTADRSLAVVDYALRRRFRFIDIKPAFDHPKFTEHLRTLKVPDTVVAHIRERIGGLNREIIRDVHQLGPGFCIGHSYFCPRPDEEKPGERWFTQVVRFEIEPLLKEYWFDAPERALQEVDRLLEGISS